MNSEKAKILVLVEGEKTDVQLFEHLLSIYEIDKKHQVFSYKTNIYVLYDQMFQNDNPDEVDIQQLLKERESDPERKKIFDYRFTDIILIFDLDPHDPRFEPSKIMRMVSYFKESSAMGKLYLNYPMVESFYHMKSIPDENYNSYFTTMQELCDKVYKIRVRNECVVRNYKKFAIDKQQCDVVINQNIYKARILTNTVLEKEEENLFIPDSTDILRAQLKLLIEEDTISVLCTCVFYIPDYNPALINLVE